MQIRCVVFTFRALSTNVVVAVRHRLVRVNTVWAPNTKAVGGADTINSTYSCMIP